MLTEIRDHFSGWVIWLITILITIPFALWGIQSYFEGKHVELVAMVNDSKILLEEYRSALLRQRQILSNRLGQDVNPAVLHSKWNKLHIIDSLIYSRIMTEYIQNQNYQFSDQQLSNLIITNPMWFEDGKFSEKRYLDFLSKYGLSISEFEKNLRETSTLAQFQDGIIDSAFSMNSELEWLLSLDTQRRKTSYVLLNPDQFEAKIPVSNEEVEEYYQSHINDYQVSASTKIDYIEFSTDILKAYIDPSEMEIQDIYKIYSNRYNKENRQVSHILFKVNRFDSEQNKAKIKEKALSVLDRAKNGENFSNLAKEFSDDLVSKNNGGNIGIVKRGQMVKSFDDAVFDMEKGEIRGLVESKFGFHIINLINVNFSQEHIWKEVKDEVIEEAKTLQAENQFFNLSEMFRNLVFEYPENLNLIAGRLNLPIRHSDWFTESSGKDIAKNLEVRQAAFSQDVVKHGLISPVIEIGLNKLITIQQKAYKPSHQKQLNEVRGEIITIIRSILAKKQVKKIGKELLSTFNMGISTKSNWDNFIKLHGLKVFALPELKTDIPEHLKDLGNVVFSHRYPQDGIYQIGGLALKNGDFAIFALKKRELSTSSDNHTKKIRLKEKILSRESVDLIQMLSNHLRNHADVLIKEENL